MIVNPNIFKAYDIRGLYPKQLNQKVAQAIGFCFTRLTSAKKVIIGRDMRTSSDLIFEALVKGINLAQATVLDIGLVSTDVVYFASGKLSLPSIMITASHNPKEWNGFKLTWPKAVPFGDEDIQKLKLAVNKYKISAPSEKKVTAINILPDYIDNVFTFVSAKKIAKLKIVVDAGNAMAGKIIPLIYAKLPCKIVPLYFKLDGNFPNHQPSPIESKNLVQLQKKIKQTKADFGMAFDGDADRVFFVDENSHLVSGVAIVALLAKFFLDRSKGQKIIYDVRCSRFIPELVKASGGQPLISRVGHSFIKKLMKETGAIFGGELSGHYYFRDNYRADSAMIAAVIITQILSEGKQTFSKMMKNYTKYYQIEETNSEINDKNAKLKEIKKKYSDGKISNLDGITVEYADWWFNVRPSNTEPLLRLNLETNTKKLMEIKKAELLKLIRKP
jgi:phosphomannomutase